VAKNMTRIKICGITNTEDALLSAKFGADALGFNFYEKSPRYIAPEKAREIIEQLPEKILKVGVFVNESLEKIAEIASIAKLDALQLHGEETPEFARELKAKTNLVIIKAFRVSPEFKPEDVLQYETDAILLDAYNPKEHGGTGETFDWEIAKKVREIFPKMYLAGGLSYENVSLAIWNVKPFAVDVCSGVEINKGKKGKFLLLNFITKAMRCLDYHSFDKFYDFLTAVRQRPELFLGEKSLSKLQIYLLGFQSALYFSKSNYSLGKYDSEEFRMWMSKRVGYVYPNSFNCMTYIREKCDGNEEKAFDLFFALLEEFKLEKEDFNNV
jgi:phosphoribosylanthranilate isomerase